MIPRFLGSLETCDEKDRVRALPALPTFHHCGICAVRVLYQQSTADFSAAESSRTRSLCAYVSGTDRPCWHELHLRPGRKAGFGFPAARARFSGHRCPRTQAGARPIEKIPRRLGKPVDVVRTLLRLRSGQALFVGGLGAMTKNSRAPASRVRSIPQTANRSETTSKETLIKSSLGRRGCGESATLSG